MNKTICEFLTSKGFIKKNQDTMIYELAKNSGIVISSFEDCEDSQKEKYEFILNYLSEFSGDPQLIFCGLSEEVLKDKFDILYQLSYNLFSFLKDKNL